MHMLVMSWTKMTPSRIPTLGSQIPDLKVGSYVTFKDVALMFLYLLNNNNFHCSTYTKKWSEEGEGMDQENFA